MNLKDLLYSFACLSFAVATGAAVYEHLAVVPQWSAAPPVSLSMFQGKYGLNPGAFWTKIHPVTLLLVVITLTLFWKTDRRKNVLITLSGYVMVLIATAAYFVPELLAITGTAFSETIDPSLTSRANQWETLSIVRLLLLIVLSMVFLLGLTKGNAKADGQKSASKARRSAVAAV